jgi:hypothetical protein
LADRENRFSVISENGNPVLQVKSSGSASGMFRKLSISPASAGQVSWMWKVNSALIENKKERSKRGDDYAARVFVLFEPHLFRWRIPAICYVWAGNEPAGSIFRSPYSDRVCTIVVQTGNIAAGKWMHQERNYYADYITCFQKPPSQVSAVAVMVDTDNTGAQAVAWFDDLSIQ